MKRAHSSMSPREVLLPVINGHNKEVKMRVKIEIEYDYQGDAERCDVAAVEEMRAWMNGEVGPLDIAGVNKREEAIIKFSVEGWHSPDPWLEMELIQLRNIIRNKEVKK